MAEILVTGGAGFLASSLADKLLESNHSVVILDDLSTGDIRKLPVHDCCRFIKGSVNDFRCISSIMTNGQLDYVFHYAAVVGVKRTLDNPVSVLNDIQGIQNVLELSKNTGIKRVFYTSSSEVYGEPVVFPQNEVTTPLNSRLPYAVVKNLGEAFCRSYYQEFGLNYTVFRFFNTYGPKQSTDFVISKFLRAALAGDPITIYGDGSQSRTFCYVDDNVDAVIQCLEQDKYVNEVVNIGNDKECTVLELANLVIRITGSKSRIEFLPPLKEGDMQRRKPDNTRMNSLLSGSLIALEDGIRKMLDNPLFLALNDLKKK